MRFCAISEKAETMSAWTKARTLKTGALKQALDKNSAVFFLLQSTHLDDWQCPQTAKRVVHTHTLF